MVQLNKCLKRANLILVIIAAFSFILFSGIIFLHLSDSGFTISSNNITATTSKNDEDQKENKVLPVFFTGDVMLARYVETLLHKDAINPEHFISLFASSSATVVNFESAMIVPHVSTKSGVMKFSVSISSLSILEKMSVTHASLANNHSRDYGLEGYHGALAQLALKNISTFGDAVTLSTSSVSFTEYGSTTIALLGIHTLFKAPSDQELISVFNYANSMSDVVVAYVHWGEEYSIKHSKDQENFAKKLVDLGADVIIGHHPHVTQDIGLINGVPVFYSLGNFIFDQYFSKDVKEGYILSLDISDRFLKFTIHPHYQCKVSTPCPMPEREENEFIEALAKRSDQALFDQIMAKNIEINR